MLILGFYPGERSISKKVKLSLLIFPSSLQLRKVENPEKLQRKQTTDLRIYDGLACRGKAGLRRCSHEQRLSLEDSQAEDFQSRFGKSYDSWLIRMTVWEDLTWGKCER